MYGNRKAKVRVVRKRCKCERSWELASDAVPDDFYDDGGVYWNLCTLEAFRIVDMRLIRIGMVAESQRVSLAG